MKYWAANFYNKFRGKFGLVEHKPAMKWLLKYWIALSDQLRRQRLVGVNW